MQDTEAPSRVREQSPAALLMANLVPALGVVSGAVVDALNVIYNRQYGMGLGLMMVVAAVAGWVTLNYLLRKR